jgi:(1->4)-alpha-D-glucan 1-alpha-D-glucosylmutase
MVTEAVPPSRPRVATYRVQLRPGFTFDDAVAVAGYLAGLGVSHLYCSPCLQAAPGSTHGYDVVDPSRLNAELGGAEGHTRLTARLAAVGLRQVLDIVPNHMDVSGPANAWWWDVLEHGPLSLRAGYFDVDWDPPQPELAGVVLVPVLGDHYGRVLEAGELTVAERDGRPVVRYHEHELPLGRHTLTDLDRDGEGRLTPAAIATLNRDRDALDALLRRQNYRLAHWRTAAEQLNYRRFFDVTTLAGVRVEDPQVFADTHRLVLKLVRDGAIDGLRIDHVDGLADPRRYLERLREETHGGYVVVEKILESGEELPDWPVAGTSGYDFLTAVNQLFTDTAGAESMRAAYTGFTGESADYAEVVYAAKLQVMRTSLAAEMGRLTELLLRVCEGHRRVRDCTRPALREALTEIIAAFGVYRPYARPGRPVSQADRDHVAGAVAGARRRRPDLDAELTGFVGELLTGVYSGQARAPGAPETDFAVHFAQVSAPVMAKGVEDTAFYRYLVLASLCEVGGDPGTFGRPVAEFHDAMMTAAQRWPEAMLTLSTHDTKRSGDVRARLALLAELPEAWREATARWAAHNQRHKRDGWPDRNAEYLLYQTLVGAWPLDAARAGAFMAKAVKEAKVHTSWTDPDPRYDEALDAFAAAVLTDQVFVAELERFLVDHQLIQRGRLSSLAQVTLLLTCPGVPDVYQGTELWDLSLVDPDNRRPVDFAARERVLAALTDAGPDEALAMTAEGGPKLWLIHRMLRYRLAHPEVFGAGYQPLAADGPKAGHVVAFTRADALAVVVPRLLARLGGAPSSPGTWAGTTVTLPEGGWTDVLTGARVPGGTIEVAALLERFPVAVLGR